MTMPDRYRGEGPSRPEERGQERGSGAREQIRQVRDQVVDQARNTIREARDRAGSSLADSRRQAADQIGSVAGAFHRTGAHLREEHQERFAGLADSFADQVDQVARYLRDADARRLARDVEQMARERPAVVYGAAFAVGLLAARFLKSGEARAAEEDEYGGRAYTGGTLPGGFDASA